MVLIFCVFSANGIASTGHGSKATKKIGILLVAYGSSEASAQVSFENIDKQVKAAYPDVPVRWAYTSHIIRAKLAKQGKNLKILPMWLFNPCIPSVEKNITIYAASLGPSK